MSTNKFLYPLFMLAIGFFSCKKENASSSDTSSERLKRMVSHSDSMWYVSFQYDGQGKLIAIKDTNSQMHIGNTTIQYDGQNRMIKMVWMRYYQSVNNPTGQKVDSFGYDNNNRIIKRFHFSSSIPGPKLINTYTYDGQGRLLVDTAYDYWSNTVWEYARFTYDGSGNIIQSERFEKNQNGVFESKGLDKISYGTQRNPYESISLPLYFYLYRGETSLSKNAVKQYEYSNGDKVTYNYDNLPNGLPSQVVSNYTEGNYTYIHTTEFFY